MEEKESRLLEMDMQVQQLSDQQVDKESLLETMQGDKTALSRAMAQNKELKNQFTELQDVYVVAVSFSSCFHNMCISCFPLSLSLPFISFFWCSPSCR